MRSISQFKAHIIPLLFLIISLSNAEENQVKQKEEKHLNQDQNPNPDATDTVSLRFLAFPEYQKSLLELSGGTQLNIDLPSNSISKAKEVPRQAEWTLRPNPKDDKKATAEKQNEEDKLTKEPSSPTSVKALPNKQQLLITFKNKFSPNQKERLFCLDLTEDFTWGKIAILNATNTEISANLGGVNCISEPNTIAVIKPSEYKEIEGRKVTHVTLEKKDKSGKFNIFYSNSWRLSENSRRFVIYYNHGPYGSIKSHSVIDYRL